MTDDKGAGDGPYGHTPVSGNSTHTGEGCKACGYVEGYAAGRASRDGLRKALEACQMIPWLSNLDPLQPLTASLRCESCDRTTQIITKALEADGEGK